MCRFALLPLVLLCLAPPASPQAVRLRAAPSDAVAARLAALDPLGIRLHVVSTAADGTLRRLAGPLELAGPDHTARAADFVARYASLFGADAHMTFGTPVPLQPRADGTPRLLRLPQLVHGWEVDGAGLTLALDAAGRATGAHGWVSAAATAVAAPTVTAAQAVEAALAQLGLGVAELTGAPSVRGTIRVGAQPVAVQRVELVVRAGLRPLTIDVDATSGAVLSVRKEGTEATGNIVFDGQLVQFQTGTGSGNAYTSTKMALVEDESGVSLPGLTLDTIDFDYSLKPGTLTGRYAAVSDTVTVLFSPFFAFPFGDNNLSIVDPLGPPIVQAEAFDHVNTYSWITRTAKYLTKITGTLPSDTCVPIIVNYDQNKDGEHVGYPNAYFSALDIGDVDGFAPGFMVFGDFDVFGDPVFGTDDFMDDTSRDPTIVSHEYFHCMASFAGLLFGDTAFNPGNTPPRAVNEAIADYASTSFHKDPLIGPVFVFQSGDDLGIPGDALRDLSSDLTLPDNLFDLVTQFDRDAGDPFLPEEHEAGEIFGCALWRARTGLKPKPADKLIVNDLGNWPQTIAEVGFPVVDETNAAEAYGTFYLECFLSLINAALAPDTPKGWKQAGKLLGAFCAHGITGTSPGNTVVLPVAAAGKAKLNFKSAFLGSLEQHAVALDLAEGQVLSITLTGDKDDGTQPDFGFDADEGDLLFGAEKVVNAAGTKVSQKDITVLVADTYLLTLSTLNGSGAYKAVIKVK
jgi:hypothetical protein